MCRWDGWRLGRHDVRLTPSCDSARRRHCAMIQWQRKCLFSQASERKSPDDLSSGLFCYTDGIGRLFRKALRHQHPALYSMACGITSTAPRFMIGSLTGEK